MNYRNHLAGLLIFLILPGLTLAQSPSTARNFVMETIVKTLGKKTISSLSGLPVDSANSTIFYVDGLGRPLQNVQWQGSPGKKDLILHSVYDGLGREVLKYLPYAAQSGNDGSFKSAALAEQSDFYNALTSWDANIVKTPYAYAMTILEASPFNRTLQQGAAGAVWQPYSGSIAGSGHTVKSNNFFNGAGEVALWSTNSLGASTSNAYAAHTLYKNIIKDENWTSGKEGTIAEFRDKQGKMVLKRQWSSSSDSLSTYYIYDDFGYLRYVIPSAVTATSFVESDAVFKNFIYSYHYDGKRRLVEKKIPGKGWDHMVYNKLDQLVLSQDSIQRTNSQWLFTKYDFLGRVIATGIHTLSGSRATLQAAVDAHTVLWEGRDNAGTVNGTGYTNVAYPTTAITYYHSLNYYDDYDFYDNVFGQPNGTTQLLAPMTKGLLTCSRITTLGTGNMPMSVNYYDKKARIVQVSSQNHLGGTDVRNNTYNFSGELIASNRTHIVGATTTLIANIFVYDHMGRRTGTKENINNQGEVVLNKLEYNEVGQLKQKHLHSINSGSSFYQNTKFSYNERGWLKGNKSSEFDMKLGYDTLSYPQYNGNISAQLWGSGYGNRFIYQYDKLNRLVDGTTTAGATMSEVLSYDMMGNIATMDRDGAGTATYTYTGNQLTSISGGGLTTSSYAYDGNGNAVTDGRLGVAVSYNHLNLPTIFYKPGLHFSYTYDSKGQKLSRLNVGTSETTDYVDGVQYSNGTIDFIQTEEGRAVNNGGTFKYEYNLTDHLGNVRYSFDIYSGAIRELQRDDYYAFGLSKPVTVGINNYLYNGKELQNGLGLYDYGARFYDATIGRFNVIDKFAEKYDGLTPYHYGANNPILNIDINGDSLWIVHRGNKILYNNGKIYNENGTTYTGPGVKTNKDGTTKLTGFLKRAVEGLNSIKTGGEAGNELITNIQDSKEHVFVSYGSSNTTTGLRITWNPSSTEGGIDEKGNRGTTSFVGLAHELAHAWDLASDGKIDTKTWFTMSDGKAIPNAEKYASHWENRIRGENGLPLRAFYGIDNDAGVGRVIIPSSRMSPNYIQMFGPYIMPYYYREVKKPKK
jgi:RHS repeat-associated protein